MTDLPAASNMAAFRVLDSIVSYGCSTYVIEMNKFYSPGI
jgi:hypothetical protein